MKCEICGSDEMKVIDSRPGKSFGVMRLRRRRRCLSCNNRITTYEISDDQMKDYIFLKSISDGNETPAVMFEALGFVPVDLDRYEELKRLEEAVKIITAIGGQLEKGK